MIGYILYGVIHILLGAFKGFSDKVMQLGETAESSENKYKLDGEGKKIAAPTSGISGLYYKMNNLKFKEKFPFSATLLVWLTDRWHKYNTFRTLTIRASDLVAYFVLIDIDIRDWLLKYVQWDWVYNFDTSWQTGIFIILLSTLCEMLGFGLTFKGWLGLIKIKKR